MTAFQIFVVLLLGPLSILLLGNLFQITIGNPASAKKSFGIFDGISLVICILGIILSFVGIHGLV